MSLSEEIEQLRAEIADLDDLRERMVDILTRTANALHGQALKDGLHSWDNLPELAEKLREQRDEAKARIVRLMSQLQEYEARDA
jgi:uncharacterized coiled-coil DUF342 family protein